MKKKQETKGIDYHETQGIDYHVDNDFETVASSGFPPMWKPLEDGEKVVIIPSEFRTMTIKKGKGKKLQENYALDCFVKNVASDNFYTGSGKNSTKVRVNHGDLITIPLSYNLLGDNRLAVEDEDGFRLSKLSQLAIKEVFAIMVIFNGKQPIGGGQTVKRFTIQAPKGTREKLATMKL